MEDKEILEQYKKAKELGGHFGYKDGFDCPSDKDDSEEPFSCGDCPAGDACEFLAERGSYKAYLKNYKAWYDRNQEEIENVS